MISKMTMQKKKMKSGTKSEKNDESIWRSVSKNGNSRARTERIKISFKLLMGDFMNNRK